MMNIRRSDERGHFNYGWLDTHHSFSFGNYNDPEHMGFRSLRVINEDRVQPGRGFPEHSHQDMEIISYVLEGALEHKDSMGNGSVIRVGDFQRMSAGTGVQHSEANHSQTKPVHFYQIWLVPSRAGVTPNYEEKRLSEQTRNGRFVLVASPDGRDDSLTLQQDARIFVANLGSGDEASLDIQQERHAWLQVLRGSVGINGEVLQAGDGVAVSTEPRIVVASNGPAEVMAFDLA